MVAESLSLQRQLQTKQNRSTVSSVCANTLYPAMDSDSISLEINMERTHSNMMCSEEGQSHTKRRFMLMTNCLLGFSYVLILALFVIILSKSIPGSSKSVNTTELTYSWNSVHDISTRTETEWANITLNMEKLQDEVAELTKKMREQKTLPTSASCDNDWHLLGESCYYFSVTSSDWFKARAFCKTKESDLVVISTAFEQTAINNIIKAKGLELTRFWIGLTDMNSEGTWEWLDGTNYNTAFKFWRAGEPNDAGGNEDCAHIRTNGEWNDVHCTYAECNAICEKKL
ncbi:CD209 antigen-like protein E isoform X3 [Xenopus tropicalis]|uniref:CD209 antigen-like protein E isoform X3 n=1 Tax=Xenopus tropicalis TaxID=8364 RepID=A0A8J1JF13_XENTR|nr:CD209 antigen-like protein E isoform X3 [Xenopus tropicalis]